MCGGQSTLETLMALQAMDRLLSYPVERGCRGTGEALLHGPPSASPGSELSAV